MTTILTTEKLKEVTSISNAIDGDTLLPYIELAETFHVEPILEDMYEDFLIKIEDDTLTADEQKFLTKFVNPCIAYYALYEAAPTMYIKMEAKGAVKKFSENSNSIDSNDFKIYRQSVLDKAVMYANRLRKEISADDNVVRNNSTGFFLNF